MEKMGRIFGVTRIAPGVYIEYYDYGAVIRNKKFLCRKFGAIKKHILSR